MKLIQRKRQMERHEEEKRSKRWPCFLNKQQHTSGSTQITMSSFWNI